MLPKIDGARRILYKGDEIYVMTTGDAKRTFPNLPDVDSYADDTVIFINGVSENKHGICAASNDFDDDGLMLFASYDNDAPEQWEPFRFTTILAGVSCLVYIYSDISEDDHLKFAKDPKKPGQDFLEYMMVSTAASKYFQVHAAISLLINGISDYSEVENGSYRETTKVTQWGEGEEGASISTTKIALSDRTPVRIGAYHKDFAYLQKATGSAKWSNVPYIKLFSDNDQLPV